MHSKRDQNSNYLVQLWQDGMYLYSINLTLRNQFSICKKEIFLSKIDSKLHLKIITFYIIEIIGDYRIEIIDTI
jgi:hypothetical protein